MILQVRTESPVPPYEQIREQVIAMISSGVLGKGAKLPTIRQLARDLGLASGTVARAYRELEAQGAIETRGRRGTFVANPPKRVASSDLQEAARSFALRAKQFGADSDRAVREVRAAFKSFR